MVRMRHVILWSKRLDNGFHKIISQSCNNIINAKTYVDVQLINRQQQKETWLGGVPCQFDRPNRIVTFTKLIDYDTFAM